MRFLFRFLTFLIIPTIAFPALPEHPPFCSVIIEETFPEEQSTRLLINYDNILAVIKAIEEDELDDRCTSEQIEKLGYLLAVLARNGIIPEDFFGRAELEQDIETILQDTREFQSLSEIYSGAYYSIEPTVLYSQGDALLCKSWISKQCHSLKKFVKKHKTEIIIGTAIAVGVGVAGVVIFAFAGTTAASSAATAVGVATSGFVAGTNEAPSTPTISPRPPKLAIAQDFPIETAKSIEEVFSKPELLSLAQIIHEETASIREALTQAALMEPSIVSNEVGSRSLAEQARELGSHMAHKILEGVAELGSIAPQLLAEISEFSERFVPEGMGLISFDGKPIDPVENYTSTILSLHETIDDVFSTDQAEWYTPEARASDTGIDFAVGVLPPPSMFSGLAADYKQLSEAGKAFDRGRYTKAGRALAKHGGRPDTVFPKPKGTPEQINTHGQEILEKILNHPERKIIPGTTKWDGDVIDIMAPGIGGARYSLDGRLIGFLEP